MVGARVRWKEKIKESHELISPLFEEERLGWPVIRLSGAVIRCLMAEVTFAGEYHWNAVLVASVDDFLVSHATARLDDRGNAGLGRKLD